MGLLVEDLLLLARLDQQRPLERKPVDLVPVVTDVVHATQVVAPQHQLELRLTPSTNPPVVCGDELRLRQVVSNLLTNAVVHTPDGTRVEVLLTAADGEVRLEVRDDGPGLAPGDAARVFERFYRADRSRARVSTVTGAGSGSGLGLSIVAALVAAHHGRVEVTSAPGQGTAFQVALPLTSNRVDLDETGNVPAIASNRPVSSRSISAVTM